jgi:hypothetical protein
MSYTPLAINNAFFDYNAIFFFSERYKLIAVLFLFLGLLFSLFFSGLIGVWLRTEFQLFCLFVYIFVSLSVPPLLLIFLTGCVGSSK